MHMRQPFMSSKPNHVPLRLFNACSLAHTWLVPVSRTYSPRSLRTMLCTSLAARNLTCGRHPLAVLASHVFPSFASTQWEPFPTALLGMHTVVQNSSRFSVHVGQRALSFVGGDFSFGSTSTL